MITLKIDVTKLDKNRFFSGKKGVYADFTMIENKNGVDEFGFNGFITQSTTKEEREGGVKLPIIGNYKVYGGNKKLIQSKPFQDNSIKDDEIPF